MARALAHASCSGSAARMRCEGGVKRSAVWPGSAWRETSVSIRSSSPRSPARLKALHELGEHASELSIAELGHKLLGDLLVGDHRLGHDDI